MIGYIYKVKCLTTNKFYIGSTTNIKTRINRHKYTNDNIVIQKIKVNNNYKIIILVKRQFESKKDLRMLENLYIIFGWKTNNCINKNMSYTNKKLSKIRDEQLIKCILCNNMIKRGSSLRHVRKCYEINY